MSDTKTTENVQNIHCEVIRRVFWFIKDLIVLAGYIVGKNIFMFYIDCHVCIVNEVEIGK